MGRIAQAAGQAAALIGIGAAPGFAAAQVQGAAGTPADRGEIVVTGVAVAARRLDAASSISILTPAQIAAGAPRGTAEVFRRLPGLRAESSSGGGNANMQVRGLPAVTGGAQFISLQEDGLPVLLFGDHNFAPADGFVKLDGTLDRIEFVRGGTAATLTTNGNGAIINLIGKTGAVPGGSIQLTKGVDYRDSRIDADYGGALGEGLHFHLGGHYQRGGDYRHTGFDAVRGGKVRLSVTKDFSSGFVRLTGQVIDQRDATFMPQPVRLTEVPGSAAQVAAGAPSYGTFLGKLANTLPGLDARSQVLQGTSLAGFPVIDGAGTIVRTDITQGIHTRARALGSEFEWTPAPGLVFSNKARVQWLSGRFVAPFTNAVDTLAHTLARAGGAAATFSNGPAAGQAVTPAALRALTGNDLVTEVALFDTELNDMGNAADDARLTGSFAAGNAAITATAGFFAMRQNFVQTWHWGRVLTATGPNPALLAVPGVTEGPVYTYNGAFGACCNARWDMRAQVAAPYALVAVSWGKLTVDGSVRRERMTYRGAARFSSRQNLDINGDGTIGPAERGVPIGDPASGGAIGGALTGTAWSAGAALHPADGITLFARASRGITWNFDRQFGAFAGGTIAAPGLLRNTTDQFEAGLKWQERSQAIPGDLALYLTAFHARANLRNFSITTGAATGGIYTADGIESEVAWGFRAITLSGNLTWTRARTSQDFTDPARSGLVPQRQAEWLYNLAVEVNPLRRVKLGASLSGTSRAFADFENRFVLPGFATLAVYVAVKPAERITVSVNANNLLNAVGFTEGDNGRLFDTDGNGAYDTTIGRSVTGRTISASVRLDW